MHIMGQALPNGSKRIPKGNKREEVRGTERSILE